MSNQLSDLVKVVHGNGDFSSKLISLVDREPGAVLAKIEGSIVAKERAYTSVQVSETSDIELNSDLVYCNHSCDPNVVFDMAKFEVRVDKDRPVKQGDDLTFFYPSTEWDMQQPFQCRCGSSKCLGTVRGAKYLDDKVLKQYSLNPHIERLMAKRKETQANGKVEYDAASRHLRN